MLNLEIENLKNEMPASTNDFPTEAVNLLAAKTEFDDWQKYKNVIFDNKKMVLQLKLQRVSKRKFKILRPMPENAEANISHRAIKMVHQRCHDDLEYMKGGPKAHLFRFRRH